MDVHVVHGVVALQIAVEARGIEGGVRSQFLHHAGDILQRARKRHGHHDGILEAVQAEALIQLKIVHARREEGFNPHRRFERIAAAGLRQGIHLLKQHRRQLHVAVAGRLRVHHALRTAPLEHERPEALILARADVGGVFDVQRVGPYGRHQGRVRADQGDAVHRGQVSAGFARPAEGRVAVAVGNQAAHAHIARARDLHPDGGRSLGAVRAIVAVRTADSGVDEVDVLHGDAHQRDLPVGAICDRHLGDEPLVVYRVAAAGVRTQRQRAGQRIGQRRDGDDRAVIADHRHVFVRQAHLTDAAIGNVDRHADRRVADVEARAGIDAHGTADGQRTTVVRVAAGDTGPAGMRVLLDGAAKLDRIDPDVSAVDVHTRPDGRRGRAGAVLAVVLALLVQPGLRIRFADALSKGIRVVVDVGRTVRRRRIRRNPHGIISLDHGVGHVHGVGQRRQRAAARLHIDAQTAAAGVGFHVEVQLAEVAVNVHVPGDDLGLARAGLADVHPGRQLQRAQRTRIRLVADARVVNLGVAVHIVRGGVGGDRHVSERVPEPRAAPDVDTRIRVHVRIGARIADRHEGGVVHARLGVDVIAAAADRLHDEAAKVRLEARAGADGDIDRAVERIVGRHIAVSDEAALGGASGKRMHPRVGERLHPDAAGGEQRGCANAGLRRRIHRVLAIGRLDADRHGDAGIMRLGLRAGVILGEDVDIARRNDLTGRSDARVRVVIAVRRQRGAANHGDRDAAVLPDDGLRIAGVVGIQLHVSGRADRRAAVHVHLRILRIAGAVADVSLRMGAGRAH